MICSIDYETSSPRDLTKIGAYKYAKSAKIMCAGYAIYEENTFEPAMVKPWRAWASEPMPPDLLAALTDPDVRLFAWNAQFERLITQHAAGIAVPLEKWHCTAARARASAYPGKLDLCAKALGIPQKKDLAGGKLMKKLSSEGSGTPEEYERVLEYCMQDVVVEATIGMVVRDLTPDEWQDYWVCERMNDRGIPVDIELARAAQSYAQVEAAEIAAELKKVTKGAVTSAKEFKRIKAWLLEQAPDLVALLTGEDGKVSLDKSARITALESGLDLPRDVEDLLHLIDDAGRASTAKYAAIENRTDEDGRLRGAYLFNGAGQTGRFSAMGFQPHNLVRDKLENANRVISAVLDGSTANEVKALSGVNILTTLARLLRPTIVAENGNVLVWADYAAVEARALPWLADNVAAKGLLDLFRKGEDVYKYTASDIYRVPVDRVDKEQRQMGKIAVLALGYQGGKNAFRKMARAYGLKIDDDTAEKIKLSWRHVNPWAKKFWSDLEAAAICAVRKAGTIHAAGRVKYMFHGDMLYALLPCGRLIAYPEPRLDAVDGKFGPQMQLTALKASLHPKKGETAWPRVALYGGLLAENCLAGDAEVLTIHGWRPLTAVGGLPVWDGEEFVPHDGVVVKGVRLVGAMDGVRMTADHRVLTQEGWKNASALEGHLRAAVRLPYDNEVCRLAQRETLVADAVCLWGRENSYWRRAYERARAFLRLQEKGIAWRGAAYARHVVAPCFRSLEFYVGAVSTVIASGVAQLRRSRHHGVPSVAGVRDVLGRHGADVSTWAIAGTDGQRAGVRARELPLGYASGAGAEHPALPVHRHAMGAHDSGRCAPMA